MNGAESYILNVVDGEASGVLLYGGQRDDHRSRRRRESTRSPRDLKCSNGADFTVDYTVLCRPINRAGRGHHEQPGQGRCGGGSDAGPVPLTKAICTRPASRISTSSFWALTISDLNTNYGLGNSLMLYLNVGAGFVDGHPPPASTTGSSISRRPRSLLSRAAA